ncbi:hypothetical protein ABGB17_02055 [Sphaerisporangium sp. B11E5]|uniref:hypothetical protein n=1 Tax=Sphaerisporangium sp. B11E5 TaxID=3153563 RepID=UPI00325C8ED8
MTLVDPAAVGAPPVRRVRRSRTVPGRIRLMAGLGVAAVVLLSGATAVAVGHAKDGLNVLGRTAGPQVVTTADLYFALSDMDAQVATILLTRDAAGPGRQALLERYERSRSTADGAVLQAADLAGGDRVQQATVHDVLDGLGRYERLAGRALLLDEQAGTGDAQRRRAALETYRQATDLMRLDLLPKAYNLTLDSATIVRRSYLAELSAVRTGWISVAVTGLLTLAVLIVLQVYLSRGFRRTVNVPLLAATVVVGALTVAGVAVLQREGTALTSAKDNGFNSVLALSRARAIGNTLYGDQNRYLLDPERADTYEQVYLDKSQAVLYVPAGNLDKYHNEVARLKAAGRQDGLGFLDVEAAGGLVMPGQRAAFTQVLERYQAFQRNDGDVRRAAAAGNRQQAVSLVMGPAFTEFDKALQDLVALHDRELRRAVDDGDGALAGWDWLPPAGALAAVALVLIGVRPRLAEYR